MEDDQYSDLWAEMEIGVICGEDIDAVLSGTEQEIWAWAISVLDTSLERVLKYGADSHELFHFAIEVVWQYAGGEVNTSGELAIRRWLDEEHPRGRQWSKFTELVRSFTQEMEAKRAAASAAVAQRLGSVDDIPF